jgi:CheY-like chemotaxis protein
VLVADDNIDSAKSLGLLLELMGQEAHIAHDGIIALELAQRMRPEVIVLDIGMPRLNGYETARRPRDQLLGDTRLCGLR